MQPGRRREQNSRPADGGERVGQSEGAENVGGDEVEAGGPAGLAQGSLGVDPFLLVDRGARGRWGLAGFLARAGDGAEASWRRPVDVLHLLAGPENAQPADFRLRRGFRVLFGARLIGIEEVSAEFTH